jgi:hypothetical protein
MAPDLNLTSSFFITSGNAAPLPDDPKPVVEDDPRATILKEPLARNFAWVIGRGAPSDKPSAKLRQASLELRDTGRFGAATGFGGAVAQLNKVHARNAGKDQCR